MEILSLDEFGSELPADFANGVQRCWKKSYVILLNMCLQKKKEMANWKWKIRNRTNCAVFGGNLARNGSIMFDMDLIHVSVFEWPFKSLVDAVRKLMKKYRLREWMKKVNTLSAIFLFVIKSYLFNQILPFNFKIIFKRVLLPLELAAR